MEPLGVLVYGYSNEDAEVIKQSLFEILNEEVIIISGSNKENSKIIDILERGPENIFKDEDTKILLFLGFPEEKVGFVLKKFPPGELVKRPIFCGLTEQNINWTLKNLVDHLNEEDKYWRRKRQEKSEG